VKHVVTAILGGGRGTRLYPLTRHRAKPAVPVAGKFRLIDIPISNSLHAGIDRIYVLTQFNSASLHRHIAQAYRFDTFSRGFVNILAAEQRMSSETWYQGTADAVRQMLPRLLESRPRDVLILSGDQLYLMAMEEFVGRHRERDADLTIAVKPVPASEAPALGIMRIDANGRIVDFVEKPQDPEVIRGLQLDAATIERLGIDAEPGQVLASMGIYTFRANVMRELLDGSDAVDFGREVIPQAIEGLRVFAHVENGYWRDIGTIRGFHEANLELTELVPELNLYSPERPVYTRPRFLPGCKVNACAVEQSILCDGSIISKSVIRRSIVGIRGIIEPGCRIEHSIVMGATHFPGDEEEDESGRYPVPLGIGADCEIRNAIIDLDARIGPGCRIVNERGVDHLDGDDWYIRDGIVVVARKAVLPAGTVI